MLLIRLRHPEGTHDLPREQREKVAPLPYVQVEKAGQEHHFSPRFVARGFAEGWLSLRQGHIHLHQPKGLPDVVYKIVDVPGEKVQEGGRKVTLHYYEGRLVG